MVLPLDGASSPHRLVILTSHHRRVRLAAGAFVSPPARSSHHRLVLLATGWFFLLLATGCFFSPPAVSSLHHGASDLGEDYNSRFDQTKSA
jgi:hypothetical protein